AEDLERPRPRRANPPLEIAALLRRHGEEHDAPAQLLERAGVVEGHRRAEHPRDWRIVAAGVGSARHGIGLGMAADDERVELADQRERRSVAFLPGRLRADAREREAGARREPEPLKHLLDELCGLHFLE